MAFPKGYSRVYHFTTKAGIDSHQNKVDWRMCCILLYVGTEITRYSVNKTIIFKGFWIKGLDSSFRLETYTHEIWYNNPVISIGHGVLPCISYTSIVWCQWNYIIRLSFHTCIRVIYYHWFHTLYWCAYQLCLNNVMIYFYYTSCFVLVPCIADFSFSYLQTLGVDHAFSSFIWLCGPITGLVVGKSFCWLFWA